MTDFAFEFEKDTPNIIKVIGVGGGGGNAINQMYTEGIRDVDFVVCNTDVQDLKKSPVRKKLQLGKKLTEGLGAGNRPERGRQAAIESMQDIEDVLDENTKMVFITAGFGGGTGTGAAPVIAKAASERDILTVAIISIPFKFEGKRRVEQALDGIKELRPIVDSLLIINNEKLFNYYSSKGLPEAFKKADDVLLTAVKGIAEIITVNGYINVDFEDVKSVMKESGVALMGSAMADSKDRALKAIKDALTSPLLNDNDIQGAKDILLNITYGNKKVLTMEEVAEITQYVEEAVGSSSNIIWGTGEDDSLEEMINVTIIATGFETDNAIYSEVKPGKRHVPKDVSTGNKKEARKSEFTPGKEKQTQIIFDDRAFDDSDKERYKDLTDAEKLHDSKHLDELEDTPAYKRSENFRPPKKTDTDTENTLGIEEEDD